MLKGWMGHLPSQGSSVLSGQTSNVWPREKRDTARATSDLSRLNGECHIEWNNRIISWYKWCIVLDIIYIKLLIYLCIFSLNLSNSDWTRLKYSEQTHTSASTCCLKVADCPRNIASGWWRDMKGYDVTWHDMIWWFMSTLTNQAITGLFTEGQHDAPVGWKLVGRYLLLCVAQPPSGQDRMDELS